MEQVYKCSCGYTTHFEKALQAHCRFRHHEPAAEPKEETILPEVTAEVVKAVKAVKKGRPRKKKTAEGAEQ